MKFKKSCFLTAILLLCFSVIFALAACGSSDGSDVTDKNERTQWGTLTGIVTEYLSSPVQAVPVAGVTVKSGDATVVTDENGAYTIEVYDNGATVIFEKNGYITQSKTFKRSSFSNYKAEYNFIMYISTKVQGVVRDKDGNALGGVSVSIGIQQTTTDSQGNFVFDKVIATSMVLKATYNGKTVIKPLYTEDMLTGSVTTEIIMG